ncbi:MAG: hypothetical protein HY305_01460, partial [Sphingobacteriales bacterium]|nr:hypothetical protein [Sphingobacteriales bacterium]
MKQKILVHSFVCISFLLVILLTGCKKDTIFKTYAKPQTVIASNSGDTLHLHGDTVYVLTTNLVISAGQVLIIDAGTLIKVNDRLSIVIKKGGRIEAKGTAIQPIVFTSSAFKGTPGFISYTSAQFEHAWNGIEIDGNYPSNIDSTSIGTGILNYVRIEFAGTTNNFSRTPCLLLQDIGSGTVIENVQVSYSVAATSIAFSGGNVNARNLVSYASGGSDLYLQDGYKGMLQNILAYRHPYFAPQLGSGTSVAGVL